MPEIKNFEGGGIFLHFRTILHTFVPNFSQTKLNLKILDYNIKL